MHRILKEVINLKGLQMKNMFKLFIMLMIIFSCGQVYAEENNASNDDILNSQQKELGISDFIKSSKEYTKENLDGINIQDVFKSAITGNVSNINLMSNILTLFGREFKNTISSIRYSIYNNCNT